MELVYDAKFSLFEVVHYFLHHHGWGHIYEAKIKVSEEEFIHVKIRRNAQPDDEVKDKSDLLFITQLKAEETIDSYMNFNQVPR